MKRTSISVIVSIEIDNPVGASFDYIVPVPLSRIFKRYMFIPAVVRTDESEYWFKSGLTRTVYFGDGSTSTEMLTNVSRPNNFSYRISAFSGSMRFLVDHIEGKWAFRESSKKETTHIDWTYNIFPRNGVSRLFIKYILVPTLRRVLIRALTIIKNELEDK